jgi:hypothetical protein
MRAQVIAVRGAARSGPKAILDFPVNYYNCYFDSLCFSQWPRHGGSPYDGWRTIEALAGVSDPAQRESGSRGVPSSSWCWGASLLPKS